MTRYDLFIAQSVVSRSSLHTSTDVLCKEKPTIKAHGQMTYIRIVTISSRSGAGTAQLSLMLRFISLHLSLTAPRAYNVRLHLRKHLFA